MSEERDLSRVLNHIYRVTGFDARPYRSSTLERRLGWRLHQTNSRNYREYLRLLKANPAENSGFIQSFLVHVSEFFRDKEVFSYLQKKVLPDLLKRAAAEPGKCLRVWSIACSKGQEPYSLAMILEELRRATGVDVDFSILATDVSEPVLRQARQGGYTPSEVKRIPGDYRKKYIRRHEKNEFKVDESIRRFVRFRRHDLIRDRVPGRFHLILCRNVLIFIKASQQVRLVKKIHAALKPGGILVLGQAESVREGKLFTSLSPQHHVYQKRVTGEPKEWPRWKKQ